jgi:hypothetical protein
MIHKDLKRCSSKKRIPKFVRILNNLDWFTKISRLSSKINIKTVHKESKRLSSKDNLKTIYKISKRFFGKDNLERFIKNSKDFLLHIFRDGSQRMQKYLEEDN